MKISYSVFHDININFLKKSGKYKYCFIVPFYNTKFILFNLRSIFKQTYTNFRVIIINDNSTEYITELYDFINKHKLNKHITIINNYENNGAAYSRYIGLKECKDNEIVVFVDGDDWLYTENVLTKLNDVYDKGYKMTMGSYKQYKDNMIDFIITPLHKNIDFNLPCRYHLRTGYAYLWNNMPITWILDEHNKYIRYMTDFNELVYAYTQLKHSEFYLIEHPLYVYNITNTTTETLNQEYKTKLLKHLRKQWISIKVV
jgi:glycosyltransferase involved in cell wall biosynthesis